MAMRCGRIRSDDAWGTSYLRLRCDEVHRGRRKCEGRVMFPTTHDITPRFLDECVTVLRKLLDTGNEVLVVSKPHLACIKRLCAEFASFREQILFRLTITAMDNHLLRYWEPEAPRFLERLKSLRHAWQEGFQTSVSVEPMLDAPHITDLFQTIKPFVTHSIWIGKMNKVRHRVRIKTPEDEEAVRRIEENQTDDHIWEIYEAIREEPLVRWKESIKEVVGLPVATEAGLDV
jgi:hypothetical protein